MGVFGVLYLLFARYFPVMPIAELKTILKSSGQNFKEGFGNGEGYWDDHGHRAYKFVPKTEETAKVETAAPVVEEKSETPEAKVYSAEEAEEAKKALLARIGLGTVEDKDDLKVISGVGPVLENKLNEMGIYTYAQVSKMTKEDYDVLDALTGSFPGRAERDDWAGQAAKLNEEKGNN